MNANEKTLKSCAFTGHRPQRFSFGFDESDERCLALKKLLRQRIEELAGIGVTDFYTGMALGVDQWAASIVLDVKKTNPAVKLTAVVPYEEQANDWSVAQRELYYETLGFCDDVKTLQTRYTKTCMFERNRYLVDHADVILAVYDGGAKGGTADPVKYAFEKQRCIIIIDPDTLAVTEPETNETGKDG
jgi:uncharacterized phage-like protein YoqJ